LGRELHAGIAARAARGLHGELHAMRSRRNNAAARPTWPLTTPIRKRDTTWVEPRYDAEVTDADITDDGLVRHPSFKRLIS
jgi:ATP dependent DNA ligase C terminal region